MTDQHPREVSLELTDEEQHYLIQYAIMRLVEDEVKRRRQPALLQPKVHPTYTPT